jgi:hypothetical protein
MGGQNDYKVTMLGSKQMSSVEGAQCAHAPGGYPGENYGLVKIPFLRDGWSAHRLVRQVSER